MRRTINSIADIEIESNTLKYRVPTTEFNVDDILSIEKNLKRKVKLIEDSPFYLLPFELKKINSNIIFYYNMEHFKSFEYLRQLSFKDQLKYFAALIQLANQETVVLWDKFNFVVDLHEENVKVFIFETDDLKVHGKSDSLEGVKELILITLTTNNQYLGKPKRVDFIDQSEEVISFAETLLRIDDLEDLDHFINTKLVEIEHSIIEEETASALVEENKKSFKIPSIKLGKKSESKPKQNTFVPGNNSEKKKGNKSLIILGVLVGVGLLFQIISPSTSETDNSNKEVKKKEVVEVVNSETNGKAISKGPSVTNSKYNDALIKAYRYSLLGQTNRAIKVLETIGYKNLSSQDRTILLDLHLKAKNYSKVVDLDPNRAIDVINVVVSSGNTDKLLSIQKQMKTKNPYIDFEVAYLQTDWKKVISLKDKVELNGRKENQIFDAYIQLKDYNKAKEFANQVGNPDLLEQLKSYSGD
ncbi:hypothetical protein [Gottfriedia solisilvae]|uniref:hypothetical protein n=1 Tax=Gottfriedia solisilvae TaxID=1516104 RepID=UPI003D2EE95D